MKKLSLPLLLSFAAICLGSEAPPSIELTAKVAKRGVKREYYFGEDGGSFARDEIRKLALDIQITSRAKKEEAFRVIWCTVVRDEETKRIGAGGGEMSVITIAPGKSTTWRTGESEDTSFKERYYWIGERNKEGSKVIGWLVAVYHNGTAIRAHGSSPEAKRVVADKEQMNRLLEIFLDRADE